MDNSDPVSYTCSCPAQTTGGSVLLFYRYFTNNPPLPTEYSHLAARPKELAAFHQKLASTLSLAGKFRIATEGFNITLGGTNEAIDAYISACRDHWSFAGLDLSTQTAVKAFFKPTPGCACAFQGKAVTKVTSEITPLGITNYAPKHWDHVTSLSPAEFHDLCARGDVPMIDVRNHYESRVGYFVNGKEEVAVRPAVRRFSQWPGYVVRHVLGDEAFRKPAGVATYCTGGIRCEKGARWMQEVLEKEDGAGAPVYTLHGGIVAYQAWFQEEVEQGRRKPEESFFKGKNYVFDARGTIEDSKTTASEPVSTCHGCNEASDRLGKCRGAGCHLVLVLCEACNSEANTYCCSDCWRIDEDQRSTGTIARPVCECELERERSLWSDEGAGLRKVSRRNRTTAIAAR